jgi:predicted dehydrogenase
MMTRMQRRDFLLTAAAAQRVSGANDRVRVGLIGCGGRGRYVARFMREAPNVEFAAVCDVYRKNAESAREWAGPDAKLYSDFRKLLEQKDLDAVLVGTPDHWHAIPTVFACQAGKAVYVEKAVGQNIRDGQAMVAAARKHNVLVMAGTQQRSAPHYQEVQQIIQSGELGEVRYVRVWNYVNRTPDGVGRPPDSDPPEGLDWDFYLGPAPKVPFNRARFLGTYRWFFDYCGGFITDYGTHRFDTVHQIMGADTPTAVSASGGRFTIKDIGDIPDTLLVTYDYPGFVMNYEAITTNGHGCGGRTAGMRYYNARGEFDRPNGEAYYGTNGTLIADRVGYEIFAEPVNARDPKSAERMKPRRMNTTDATSIHARHFIACIRGQEKPRATIETGHKASNVGHIGNIAYKTGKKLRWNGQKEDFLSAPEASKLLGREARKPWNLI